MIRLLVLALITFLQPTPEDDPFAPSPTDPKPAAATEQKPSQDDAAAVEPTNKVAVGDEPEVLTSPPILRLNP
ncbi:MAG: hypothetical protein M3552_17680 [Planctomycetota bacterium]|nr:hypothetical protein [Planctomycetota bacterium]